MTSTKITRAMQSYLREVLYEHPDYGDDRDERTASGIVTDAQTFADAGILSANDGIVITLDTGDEVQLTIVDTNPAADDEDAAAEWDEHVAAVIDEPMIG